jgi:hypothetical protein
VIPKNSPNQILSNCCCRFKLFDPLIIAKYRDPKYLRFRLKKLKRNRKIFLFTYPVIDFFSLILIPAALYRFSSADALDRKILLLIPSSALSPSTCAVPLSSISRSPSKLLCVRSSSPPRISSLSPWLAPPSSSHVGHTPSRAVSSACAPAARPLVSMPSMARGRGSGPFAGCCRGALSLPELPTPVALCSTSLLFPLAELLPSSALSSRISRALVPARPGRGAICRAEFLPSMLARRVPLWPRSCLLGVP